MCPPSRMVLGFSPIARWWCPQMWPQIIKVSHGDDWGSPTFRKPQSRRFAEMELPLNHHKSSIYCRILHKINQPFSKSHFSKAPYIDQHQPSQKLHLPRMRWMNQGPGNGDPRVHTPTESTYWCFVGNGWVAGGCWDYGSCAAGFLSSKKVLPSSVLT